MQEMARYDSYARWTATPSSIAWGRRRRLLPLSLALSVRIVQCATITAALAIAAVSTIAAVAPVLLVVASAAADAVSL